MRTGVELDVLSVVNIGLHCRCCAYRMSWPNVADLGRGNVHHSGAVGRNEASLSFILHILIGNIEVESVRLIHGRVGILLSHFWPLFGSRCSSVSPQIVREARLTFTILVFVQMEFLILKIVTQRSFTVYVVVNAAQKLESYNFFVVGLRVVLLTLIDNCGKLQDLRAQKWFKLNNNIIKLHIPVIFGLCIVVRELDIIQYFNVNPFA